MFHRTRTRLAGLLLAACAALPGITMAAVLQGNPGNYRGLLAQLQPGDTLQLVSGTYTDGLPLSGLNGSAGAWIRIEGPSDGSAVFTAQACCNTIEIGNSAWLEIRQLTLDGLGMSGPFGVNSSAPSHDIVLDALWIHDFDGDQQTVGISTKASAWNWTVRNCRIERAGTGMYFGDSNGSAPFVAGLIERNVVVDTIGYNLQIKHQNPRPTGLGLPSGTSRTIIRHNVFSKGAGSSTGALARPNVLIGHLPLSGAGQDDHYEIYGNFFYRNATEALFQGEGNLAIYANLFVNDAGSAVNVQAHNDRPRQVEIFQNTVVAAGSGIRISGGDPAFRQRVRANAVFAATPLAGGEQSDNVTGSEAGAASVLAAPFDPPGSLDLYPLAGQLTGAPPDLSGLSVYSDWNLDFNGLARDPAIRGAYGGSGDNPGWMPVLDFKPASGTAPPAPVVSLSASPGTVVAGGSVGLSWHASGASHCTASGGWSGSRPTSGSENSAPLTADTQFTLACSNAGGQASDTVLVTVGAAPAPTVTLSASDLQVDPGGRTSLSWSSQNASSCLASGGWSGPRPLNGSELSPPLNVDTGFSLSCSGAGGSAGQTITVGVNQPAPARPPAASADNSGGGASGPAALLLLGWLAWRRAPGDSPPGPCG